MHPRIKIAQFIFALACLPATSCDRKSTTGASAPAGPTPLVTITHPTQMQTQPHVDFTGRTEAVEMVEVRPRVGGFLESVEFEPGRDVKEGDLLFKIDNRLYQAEVDEARAQLTRTQATLNQADIELTRLEDLFKRQVAAQIEYDRAVNTQAEARAEVAAADAALKAAQLNLEWTRVTAPISGRVSRNLVDRGNLVRGGLGEATLLTTIVRRDPIYAYLDIDERTVLEVQKAIRQGEMESYREGEVPAYLGLATESDFPHKGHIDFVENRVDPNTGTLRVRAVFPNPEMVLFPGLFARIRVFVGPPRQSVLIPEEALGVDQGRRYVYVVNDRNVVEYRQVRIGAQRDTLRIIESGVGVNDRVMTQGLLRVRPGDTVATQTAPVVPATSRPATASTLPTTRRSDS
ncbi:MAG TPA: efflux RND transporter periplasmic adaptor subunit [Phycisphaerae bacterium]|nr:efflux RND transporter periplasmic adaptor subunit [Phycisphaerae bacterium]